jgi:hypothetical protein
VKKFGVWIEAPQVLDLLELDHASEFLKAQILLTHQLGEDMALYPQFIRPELEMSCFRSHLLANLLQDVCLCSRLPH